MSKTPKNPAEVTIDNLDTEIPMLTRHARHQRMLEDHHHRRCTARERHHRGWHRRKLAPINLCY